MVHFFANSPLTRKSRFRLLALVVGVCGPTAHAHDVEQTWYLVQPLVRTATIDPLVRHYAKVLPQYLDGKVVLRNTGKSPMPEREKVGLNDERADNSATLLAPLIFERTRNAELAERATARTIPLHMMARRPWCLAITHDVQPRNYEGLKNWLKGLNRPVRIGLVSPTGMPAVWLQAMRRKTGLEWVATDFFFSAEQGMDSLLSGQQDLLLDSCSEVKRLRPRPGNESGPRKIQVLITDQKVLDQGASSFAQWQLTAPAPTWVGWFTSSKMPEARREKLSRALQAVTQREDTLALIREMGQEPMPLSLQASQRYVETWLSDWKSISNWMGNLPSAGSEVPTPKLH